MATLKTESLKFKNNEYEFIPPLATETDRGGIIASVKTEEYTDEIKIGEDGKLYSKPSIPQEELDKIETSLNTTNDNVTSLQDQLNGYKIRVLSEEEYNNLGTYDSTTIYYCY